MSAGDCWVQWVDSVMKLSHPYQLLVQSVCYGLQQHYSCCNVTVLSVVLKMLKFTVIQMIEKAWQSLKANDARYIFLRKGKLHQMQHKMDNKHYIHLVISVFSILYRQNHCTSHCFVFWLYLINNFYHTQQLVAIQLLKLHCVFKWQL